MPRNAWFVIVLVGCGRQEPSSSAPPPDVSLYVPPLAPASASAAPVDAAEPSPPVVQPLAGFPRLDGVCREDSDCAAAFYDDRCCSQCEPRIGNKGWVKKVNGFCTSKAAEPRGACAPTACSWAFGRPRCVDGGCVSQ